MIFQRPKSEYPKSENREKYKFTNSLGSFLGRPRMLPSVPWWETSLITFLRLRSAGNEI